MSERRVVERVVERCPTCNGTGFTHCTNGDGTHICWHCHQVGVVCRSERDITEEYDALRAERDALRKAATKSWRELTGYRDCGGQAYFGDVIRLLADALMPRYRYGYKKDTADDAQ